MTQFCKNFFWRQYLPGLFLLLCIGLWIPQSASAQVLPPPPPIEDRWEAEFKNPIPGPDTSFSGGSQEMLSGAWGLLTFQSYRDNNWEIYVRDQVTNQDVRLTNHGANDLQPRINPGATRVAFTSNRDGDYEIYVVNVDGTGLAQLTFNNVDDVAPAWSPDASHILFQTYQDGQAEIYVMDPDGANPTRLTNDPAYDGQPDWSPDGTQIAFSSKRSGDYRIWVMNSDGSNPVMISAQNSSAHPHWSLPGALIGYDADSDNNGWQELWVVNVDGSSPRRPGYTSCTNSNSDCLAGRWVGAEGMLYTQIDYVYYQNQWYWTNSRLYSCTFSAHYGNSYTPLAGFTGVESSPDWQPFDISAPVSIVTPLPAQSPYKFQVDWSATHGSSPFGVSSYDVEVRDGANGTWTSLFIYTKNTTLTYQGVGGHTYYFRVRARDSYYHVEPWPADYDTATTVDPQSPVTTVNPLPLFSHNGFTVSWGGNDPGDSGIKGYDVQYRIDSDGTWVDWQTNTLATSAQLMGGLGHTYYFRSRATDHAQNVEAWPAGDGDTQVTIYAWQVSGNVHDNAGLPVSGVQTGLTPTPVKIFSDKPAGNFVAYGLQGSPTYTATWSKGGYGSLPATTFATGSDAAIEIALPPGDNLISNSGFETGGATPQNWQNAGALPVIRTNKSFHTGQFAAQLGEASPTTWTASEKVGNSLNSIYNSNLAVDSQGTVHAVWIIGTNDTLGYNTQLYYSSKPNGGSWTTPVLIYSGNTVSAPYITVDLDDNLHLTWQVWSTYYAYKPKNGSWTAPELLYDYQLNGSRIVIDSHNQAHLFGFNHGLEHAYRENGMWSALTPIMPTGQNAMGSVVIDSEDTIHTVFQVSDGYGPKVYYAFKSLQGTWSSPVQISSDQTTFSSLTMDSEGGLYVAWSIDDFTDRRIEFRKKPKHQGWSEIEKIHGSTYVFAPVMAVNLDRVEMIYLSSAPGDNIKLYFTEKKGDAPWTSPTLIPQSNSSTNGHIALGPNGAIHVLWFEWLYPELSNANGEIRYSHTAIASQSGDALLTQTITIPDSISTPTLSFFYQFEGPGSQAGSNFNVNLQTPAGQVNLMTTAHNTTGWTFQSLDLSAWRGQTVTLEFNTHQVAGWSPAWAVVDEVTVGSTYSDLWVSATEPRGLPGQEVTYVLTCGNRGAAPAKQTQMTVDLPAGLTFVSALPAPSTQGSQISWDLGDLPAQSSACTVRLTVQIGANVSTPQKLPVQVKVTTTSAELDTTNNLKNALTMVIHSSYLPTIRR